MVFMLAMASITKFMVPCPCYLHVKKNNAASYMWTLETAHFFLMFLLYIPLNICAKNLKSCQHVTVELRKPEPYCHKRAKWCWLHY